jgi:hypothetical protein
MPVKNNPSNVALAIQQALADKHLSGTEADQLLDSVKKEGVTAAEVNQVVESLTAAMRNDGLDFSSTSQQDVLSKLLGTLKEAQPDAGLPSTGSMSVMGMLTHRAKLDHHDFPTRSYSGESLGVSDKGDLIIGDKQPVIDLKGATDSLISGLWALNRPGQLPASDAGKSALADKLINGMGEALTVEGDDGKYRRGQGITASLGAMSQMNVQLTQGQQEKLLTQKEQLTTPLQKALMHRLLEKQSSLSPQLQNAKEELSPDDEGKTVLAAFDDAVNEKFKVGYREMKGAANENLLGAITFAKKKSSLDNIISGMQEWDKLEPGYQDKFSGKEIAAIKTRLEGYIDGASAAAFTFGSFSSKAPKNVAKITSEEAVTAATPGLESNTPNLNGFPLTSEQGEYIQKILGNVKDKAAVENMRRSLANAHATLGGDLPNAWGDVQNPTSPMGPAAFRLFQEKAQTYQDAADSSKTGKLDYKSFASELREDVEAIRSRAEPRLLELNGQPAKWNGVALDTATAEYLKTTMNTNLRSFMTVENLDRAVAIYAKNNDDKITGDASGKFRAMMDSYKSNWPGRESFDFNKLERMATYAVRGEPMPKCMVNGKEVNFAEFYNVVGSQVSERVDRLLLKESWMAERWGYRASKAVEVLDVIAEKTARGEGPVAELRRKFPGKEIEILYTGRDGAHEQFAYTVEGFWGDKAFAQGSDGKLKEVGKPSGQPLFKATINDEGVLNVAMADRLALKNYPLNSDYGVGDTIDLPYRDRSASEGTTEGEEFNTQNKVVEATIKGFTADGDYLVELTNPKGEKETKTVSMGEIRRANNPHWFKLEGSNFSDVSINVNNDAALKKFLDDAQPIIDRHLPKDGSLVGLSAAALARKQKSCIKELMKYTKDRVHYPKGKESSPDDAAKKYHDLTGGYGRFDLGELALIERGVCRHQCIFEHLLLQKAGIDSRLASGAANTSSNKFRGYHIWTEVTLADGGRYLSDQTWDDPTVPLWSGAYSVDKRRAEMYHRTARYDGQIQL